MSFADILKTALWSLGSNKLRSGLTLLGIVIGVTAVIALMTIGRGVQDSITSRIESQGTNLLYIQPGSSTDGGVSGGIGSASTLTLDDAYALDDAVFAPSVKAVAPELSTNAQIVAGRENTNAQVIGTTSEYPGVRNQSVAEGRFITINDLESNALVTVLSASVAEDLFGAISPVGQNVRIDGRQFLVVGLLESVGTQTFGNNAQAFIPITTAYYRLSSQRTTSGAVSVQMINVEASGPEFMDSAQAEVSTVLRLRHRITGEDDFVISSQQGLIETLEATTTTLVIFLGTIAGISLVVGGIGVMNIMLVSVTERTREIGIRKAIGAKRRDIMFQFLTEAIILTIGGGLVGMLLGYGMTPALNGLQIFGGQGMSLGIRYDVGLIALLVSAIIGLFSGIYPAMRASAMAPIDALRYE